MNFTKWVKSIQTAGYYGTCTIIRDERIARSSPVADGTAAAFEIGYWPPNQNVFG